MNNEYCKIPKLVKSNKHICSNAKLLYGDILLLCHKNGYSLGLTPRTITRLIKELKDENLISISYTDDNVRKIYLV